MRGRDENRTIIKFGFLIFMYVHDLMSVPNWKVVLLAAWSHLDEVINTTAATVILSNVLAHTAVLEAQGDGESSAC